MLETEGMIATRRQKDSGWTAQVLLAVDVVHTKVVIVCDHNRNNHQQSEGRYLQTNNYQKNFLPKQSRRPARRGESPFWDPVKAHKFKRCGGRVFRPPTPRVARPTNGNFQLPTGLQKKGLVLTALEP